MNKKHCKSRYILATVLLCMFFSFELLAQNVKFSFKNTPIKTILVEVSEQTGFKFIYSNALDVVNSSINFDMSADKKDIDGILKKLFEGQGVSWKITGKQVVIAPSEIISQNSGKQNQDSKLSGKISDGATGETIPGAAVKNMRTNEVVVANDMGEFSIGAQQGDVLAFTSIGMKDVNFTVTRTDKVVSVVMEMDLVSLEDVVVTGYQTISKERSAGSYNIVKGDDVSRKMGLTGNILQSMEGLATGLNVNMSEGADKFSIRGITSINSNRSPLFVVDGIPLEAHQVEVLLNDNDVESITILKDATSASIWGAQAANGVVVISTKKGTDNGKINVSYKGSFSYSGMPDYEYLNKMDNELFLKNASEMFDIYSKDYSYNNVKTSINGLTTHSNPVIMPHERIMYRYLNGEITESDKQNQLAALALQNGRDDYEEYFMSNKHSTRHSIAMSGGSKKASYYLSLGYTGNNGYNKDNSKLFSFNTKNIINFTKWLKWDLTLNASYGKDHSHLSPWFNYTDGMYAYMLSSTTPFVDIPYATFYGADGLPIDWSQYVISQEKRESIESLTDTGLDFYPVEDFGNSLNNTKTTNVRVNTGLSVNLLKGLTYEARFQYSKFHSSNEKYLSEDVWKVREEILASTPTSTLKPWLPTTGGNFVLTNSTVYDWTLRNQITYDNTIKENHKLAFLLGTEVREYKNTAFNNFLRGYDIQTMQYTPYDNFNLNWVSGGLLGSTINTFNRTYYKQTETIRKYFSLYSNIAYTFKDKYSLNGSIRIDQSNLFGSNPGNQYKPVWAVGAAWKISEEKFMQNINWIDRLNIRASFGFAGNSPQPGQGGSFDILIATTSSFYESSGLSILTPANDQITWEKTRTWNVGADGNFFKNRFNLSIDYYDKKSTDLIGNMLLNPISGWTSTTGNVGTLENRGIEISINSHNIKAGAFNWYSTLTFTNNANKITKLDVAAPYTAQTLATLSSLNVAGYPINSLFSYRYAGLNENGEPQAYTAEGKIVSGINSKGMSDKDVVYSGTIIPKYYGGFTNRLTYKDWELSFMFVYNLGHKMRKECETLIYGRATRNMLKDFDNRWRKPGDEQYTNIPAWNSQKSTTANYNLYYYSDANILDASYIKLRDISLAYNVPASFCNKIRAEGIRISFQVGNLFYWAANNEGIDPEYYILDTHSNNRMEKLGASYALELNINF